MKEMTPEGISITELAETIKEVIRIMQLSLDVPPSQMTRLDAAYKKASKAKDRIEENYK